MTATLFGRNEYGGKEFSGKEILFSERELQDLHYEVVSRPWIMGNDKTQISRKQPKLQGTLSSVQLFETRNTRLIFLLSHITASLIKCGLHNIPADPTGCELKLHSHIVLYRSITGTQTPEMNHSPVKNKVSWLLTTQGIFKRNM